MSNVSAFTNSNLALPKAWKLRPLGDIASVTMGNSPPGKSYNDTGEGMPLINGPVEFSDGPFGLTKKTKFTTSPTKTCNKGDFLICVRGSTTGRTNIAADDACIGRGVAAISAKTSQRYLNHFIRTLEKKIHSSGRGSTFPSISQTQLVELLVPVPDFGNAQQNLAEQERIAGILDKADSIRRKRQQAIGLTKQFLRSTFLDMFGDPMTNPKGWPIEKLCDVVAEGAAVCYGIVQCGPHMEDGIPYIKTSEMSRETLGPLETFSRTSREIAAKYKRSTLETGDLVFANRATIGAVVKVPEYLSGANLTQGTSRISPGPRVTSDYLLWLLRTQRMQAWFDRWAKGATFREITMTQLRLTPIPVPPLDLQEDFAALAARLSRAKSGFNNAIKDSDNLFNSLVQRAFRGNL